MEILKTTIAGVRRRLSPCGFTAFCADYDFEPERESGSTEVHVTLAELQRYGQVEASPRQAEPA